MHTPEIKGDWNIVRGRLKHKFPKLTDNDLRYRHGQEDELVGRIQKRTGETREEVERVLRECAVPAATLFSCCRPSQTGLPVS